MDRETESGEHTDDVVLKLCEYCGDEVTGRSSLCRECKFPKFAKKHNFTKPRKKQTYSSVSVHSPGGKWTREEREQFLKRSRGWTIGKGWDS